MIVLEWNSVVEHFPSQASKPNYSLQWEAKCLRETFTLEDSSPFLFFLTDHSILTHNIKTNMRNLLLKTPTLFCSF